MSYLDLERELDRAVVFLGEAAAEFTELPRAFVLHSIRVGHSLQEARFGRRVAQLVEANTEDNSLSRLDRPREVIDRCHHVGREALLVRAADLEDNLPSTWGRQTGRCSDGCPDCWITSSAPLPPLSVRRRCGRVSPPGGGRFSG